MARYDSPGYATPMPGIGPFDAHDDGMSAPGQGGGTRTDGAQVGDVTIRNPYSSAQQPGTDVSVGASETDVVNGYDSPSPLFPSVAGLADTGAAPGHVVSAPRKPGQHDAYGRTT